MLTLQSTLDRTRRLYGGRCAITDVERNFTWREHIDRVARAAGLLKSFGLGFGQRFGIISRNGFRHAELLHAGYWLGAVPVPVNWRLAPAEMQFILEDSDCRMVVVEDVFLDQFADQAFSRWHDNAMCLSANSDNGELPQYETGLAKANPLEPVNSAEDDDAILLYTGGTTGRSKGVRLSHRNILANAMQVAIAMQPRPDDVFLHIAPMFHSADLLPTAFSLQGACHCYLANFSPKAVLQAIETYRITTIMAAPTMLIMILTEENTDNYKLNSLRKVFYGSSPMAAEWIVKCLRAFPEAELQNSYGLTETSPILTTLDMAEHRRALETGETEILRSVGRPVVGVDLRIVDDSGNEVPSGDNGEIAIRAPNVCKGYLNRPDENSKAFRDGWFYTGDIGRVDASGYLYLLDRKKDMVITGGENVYTSEVEAAIYKHPNIQEAAVIGVPDNTYGEALLAVIVCASDTTITSDQLIAHCRNHIGGYKIPRRIEFVDQLPKNAMGKILKHELRRQYSTN